MNLIYISFVDTRLRTVTIGNYTHEQASAMCEYLRDMLPDSNPQGRIDFMCRKVLLS